MTTKKLLRKKVLQEMKERTKAQKLTFDEDLYEQLFKHDYFIQAKSVAIVLSMDHEVNTDPIIEELLKLNKEVYVPTTNYLTKEMKFQRLYDMNSISFDSKGIRFITKETEISDDIDLIIVPGVVFRHDGYRIGYGGGYFDKYLADYTGSTLSLVYPIQIHGFDIESHDVPVQELLLPREVYGEK